MAETATAPRRRYSLLRWGLAALAVLLLLPAAAVAVFLATFDAEAWKPRLAAAVEGATGRALTLAGPVSVQPSLVPTIALEQVALANAPGGSRPQMLTLRRAEVRLALLPLLRREVRIRRLLLVEPDLLLETDAQGRPNWLFAPPPEAATAAPAAAPPQHPAEAARDTARRLGVAVDALRVERGRVTYRAPGNAAPPRVVEIARLDAAAPAEEPIRLTAALRYDGQPIELHAETGPLAGLASPDRPWPVTLTATAAEAGLRLSAEGALARPAERAGARFRVQAEAADLVRLAPLVPDLPLPALREVGLSATLAQAAPGDPAAVLPVGGGDGAGIAVTDLMLRAGASDLNALREGLRLTRLELAAPAPDRPVAVSVEAALGALPLALQGSLGPPLAVLRGGTPFPLDLALRAGAAEATVKGTIADARALTGVDLALAAQAPDLPALAPLLAGPGESRLPPLRDVVLRTRLAERGAGFAGGAHLRDLNLSSSAGEVAGELTYVIGQRPGMMGRLASSRLDLDALWPPPAQPGAAAGATAVAAAPPEAARRDPSRRVIPEIALPLAALRLFDADLRWRIDRLAARGATLEGVEASLELEAGRGRAEVRIAGLPGHGGNAAAAAAAPATLVLAADVAREPPAVSVLASAAEVDVAALLAALGQPPRAAGRLGVDAALHGRGRDTRALAATLDGTLGLAGTEGEVDATLLEPLLAPLRQRGLPLPALPARIGISCLALRTAAQGGVLHSQALLLESSIGKLGGGGTVNLADEALDLRILADLRIGGIRVSAPVTLRGTLGAPSVPQEQAVASGAAAALEVFRSLQRTPDRGLDEIARGIGGGGVTLPDCASQLALARGNRAGPAAPTAAGAAAAADAAPPQAAGTTGTPPAAPASPHRAEPREQPLQALPPPARQLLRGLLGR